MLQKPGQAPALWATWLVFSLDLWETASKLKSSFSHQNQQREFTLRQAKEMEKDAKQRLAIQRQEYEAAIQRHLSFIDQLIDDKKVLGERCEEVVNKLKSTDKKYGDKIKQMEEK